MRFVLALSRCNSSARCHAMASPSRSSSLASQTISAFFARSFSFLTTLFLSFETIYLGVKSPSTSTPNSLVGKSAICPKLLSTLKSFPRNFSMVLAFAGDSTITKFFAILCLLIRHHSLNLIINLQYLEMQKYIKKYYCFEQTAIPN